MNRCSIPAGYPDAFYTSVADAYTELIDTSRHPAQEHRRAHRRPHHQRQPMGEGSTPTRTARTRQRARSARWSALFVPLPRSLPTERVRRWELNRCSLASESPRSAGPRRASAFTSPTTASAHGAAGPSPLMPTPMTSYGSGPRVGSAPAMANEPLFDCEAIGCERPADWAHVDQFGAMYLCEFHGGAINIEGWTRITRENRDAE